MNKILKWMPIKWRLSKELLPLPHANEGEVWWVKIGQNLGTEIYGKGEYFTRPVYLLKKNSRFSFICLPLTSNLKPKNYKIIIEIKGRQSALLYPQARCIDTIRFDKRIGRLSDGQMKEIRNSFFNYINLNPQAELGERE